MRCRQRSVSSKAPALRPADVIGVVSLIIWALLIIVTAKYVVYLMKADNKGEGGILSLMALAQRALGQKTPIAFLLGVAGAALFSGDAVITPGNFGSLRSRGLKAGRLQSELPTSCRRPSSFSSCCSPPKAAGRPKSQPSSARSWSRFSLSTPSSEFVHIASDWRILQALSPIPGAAFIYARGTIGFIVLGSVFLAVTGAEALYADMGHFGRRPIQAAWLFIVLPALVCNYLGQGALILTDPSAVKTRFI